MLVHVFQLTKLHLKVNGHFLNCQKNETTKLAPLLIDFQMIPSKETITYNWRWIFLLICTVQFLFLYATVWLCYNLNLRIYGVFCGRLNVGHLRQTHFHICFFFLFYSHTQSGHQFHWLWLDSSRAESGGHEVKGLQIKSTAWCTIGVRAKANIWNKQHSKSVSRQLQSIDCTEAQQQTQLVHTWYTVYTQDPSTLQFGPFLPLQSLHLLQSTLIYLFQSLPLLFKLPNRNLSI